MRWDSRVYKTSVSLTCSNRQNMCSSVSIEWNSVDTTNKLGETRRTTKWNETCNQSGRTTILLKKTRSEENDADQKKLIHERLKIQHLLYPCEREQHKMPHEISFSDCFPTSVPLSLFLSFSIAVLCAFIHPAHHWCGGRGKRERR